MEPLYLLMVRVSVEGPDEMPAWVAAGIEGVGRKLTRAQAEGLAQQTSHSARFLFPFTNQTEDFGKEVGALTLAMMPGDTIWNYGQPLGVDVVALFRDNFDGALSPDPDAVLIPVEQLVTAAIERFGEHDRHGIETALDEVVMELGGRREGEPAGYRLPISLVFGIVGG